MIFCYVSRGLDSGEDIVQPGPMLLDLWSRNIRVTAVLGERLSFNMDPNGRHRTQALAWSLFCWTLGAGHMTMFAMSEVFP